MAVAINFVLVPSRQCDTCAFYYSKDFVHGGECRNNPPTAGVDGLRLFPIVRPNDVCGAYEWCGDFKR